MSFCPVTGKVNHQDRLAALKAIQRIKSGGVYQCRYCKNWHVTRQSKRKQEEVRHNLALRPPGDWV